MINEIIREIEGCLKSGYYMAALTTALTIPDICGKAEYPELDARNDIRNKTQKRYVDWYNKYIGDPEKRKKMGLGEFYENGLLVYSLRCSLLHQGTPNISDKERSNSNIDYFELLYQKDEGAHVCMGALEARIIKVLDEDVHVNK